MAVWQRPSKVNGKHQARHALQPPLACEAYSTEDGSVSNNKDLGLPYSLEMRTPEQTALIALRGLLEAKEMHIQKLEVGIEALTEAHVSAERSLST